MNCSAKYKQATSQEKVFSVPPIIRLLFLRKSKIHPCQLNSLKVQYQIYGLKQVGGLICRPREQINFFTTFLELSTSLG